MESPPPDKIQKVIKSIIPPKVLEAEEESNVDDDQPEETSTQEEKAAPEVRVEETKVAVN